MRKFITLLYKRSSNVQNLRTLSTKKLITSQDERREMMALWPGVIKDLTADGYYSDIPDVTNWALKILEYNVSNGNIKYTSDIISAYRALSLPDQLTDENIRLARILGWCSEIMQASFVMVDDVMDHGSFRNGKVCWHLRDDIGLAAINDGILLEQMTFQLLRIHFGQQPYYLDLLDTIHENLAKTTMGQALDMLMNHERKPNFNLFTMDRYIIMAKYKPGYWLSVLPFTLAMHLAGVKDNKLVKQVKGVLLEMGNFIRAKEDYFDCFGDPQITGKVSIDIEEGKCCWPIVVALERVNPAQRKILEECYGENDPEKVSRVMQVYHELGLQEIYSDYQEKSYNLLKKKIQQTSHKPLHDLLFEKLNSIFRKKGPINVHVEPAPRTITNKDENQEMMALWPDIVQDLIESGRYPDNPDVTEWMKKLLDYNVLGGKMTRASDLVEAYKQLAPPDQLTDENIRLARILGWCNEMMQASFLMVDDLMDRSEIRRGKPSWYVISGITAANDGILMEQLVYQIVLKYFREKPCYLDLVHTYHESVYRTIMGQTLDMISTNHGKKPNLNLFTMDRYNATVKYKTSYYTFVMPVKLAMHLAEIKDKEMFRQAEMILLKIGNFFQVQDDYIDCFGNPQVIGKAGTDIQEGKCSWPIVVALERATPAQRKILEECYGINDSEKVTRVKQLYRDLGLQSIYSVYEEENYNLIKSHIKNTSCGLPHDLFEKILNKLYHRNK